LAIPYGGLSLTAIRADPKGRKEKKKKKKRWLPGPGISAASFSKKKKKEKEEGENASPSKLLKKQRKKRRGKGLRRRAFSHPTHGSRCPQPREEGKKKKKQCAVGLKHLEFSPVATGVREKKKKRKGGGEGGGENFARF